MFAKIFVLCAQTLLVKTALSQCTSRAAVADHADIGYGLREPYGYGMNAYWGLKDAYNYGGFGCGSAIEYSPTSGGGLHVSSASAIAPFGLSVTSENEYKGQLVAAGELPFFGTVSVEGVLPTAGAGEINHHCGDGSNAIVSDKTAFAPGYIGAAYIPTAGIPTTITPEITARTLGFRPEWSQRNCEYAC